MRLRCDVLRFLLAAVAAAGLCAASSAPALAAPPTPKSKRIVAVVSIGGVKLGQSYATASRTWGPGSTCALEDQTYRDANGGAELDRSDFTGICSWRVDETAPAAGSASLVFERGKVNEASLRCAQDAATGEPNGRGPIGKFRLTKGKTKIGCGSTISKLIKTFPQAEPTPSGVGLFQKNRMLSFGSDAGEVAGVALLYAKNY